MGKFMEITLTNNTVKTISFGTDVRRSDATELPAGSTIVVEDIIEVLFLKLPSYKTPIYNDQNPLHINEQFIEIKDSYWTHVILFQEALDFWDNAKNNVDVGGDEN